MDEIDILAQKFMTFVVPDESIRGPSEAYVLNLMANDTVRLIFECSCIIMKDGYESCVYFFALDCIRKSFTPGGSLKIENIREVWLKNDPQKRDFVKNAVIRGLAFPDVRILNMAAYTFATIFAVERDEMLEFIDKLFGLIQSNDYTEDTHVAGVLTITEICQEGILGAMTESDDVKKWLLKITQFVGSLFSDPSNSEPMKIQLGKTLEQLVKIAKPLFNEINIFRNFVSLVINYLGQNPSVEYHSVLIQILLSITKTFYSQIKPIFQYIGIPLCNIILKETDNEKVMNALDFWCELSRFEIKKIKEKIDFCNRYNSKLENMKSNKNMEKISFSMELNNLSKDSIPIIGERLFYLLSSIQNEDIDPEGFSGSKEEIHQKAFICLANFYILSPEPIFNLVYSFWINNNPFTSPYPIRHALLLTIVIISSQPHSQIVYNFLTQKINEQNNFYIYRYLVDCLSSKIPRIVETALYAIRALIEEYGIYVTMEILPILINPMSKLINSHKSIVNWVISVVGTIGTKCYENSSLLILEKYFGSLIRFSDEILKQENIDSDLIQSAYQLLELLIYRSPSMFRDPICKVLNNSISKLNELSQGLTNVEKRIVLSISHIQIINACFKKYPKEFSIYGLIAANAVFKIMKYQSSIYEDAFLGLMSIISSLNSFSEDFYQEFIPHINIAIQSQNPSLITKTVMTLSTFYSSVFSNGNNKIIALDLEKRLPDTITLICNCLQNSMFTRNFYPELLKGLANVIKATAKIISSRGRQLLEIYQSFLNTPLDLRKEDDIEYGKCLYEAILLGYDALLYTLSEEDTKDRGIRRIFLDKFPKKILSLEEFSTGELKAFCNFLESFNNVFGTNGNIILNRITNYQLMLTAMCLKPPFTREQIELTKLAERTWKMVSHA